jgi:hypothetical protein
MDVVDAGRRLRSLAENNAKRSKTAVLADVLADIEKAIRAGVPHAAIVDELRSLGLDINVAGFRSALRRLRVGQDARVSSSALLPPTDFAPSPFGEEARSVRTTASGSLYDEGALCRLLRASGSTAPRSARAFGD